MSFCKCVCIIIVLSASVEMCQVPVSHPNEQLSQTSTARIIDTTDDMLCHQISIFTTFIKEGGENQPTSHTKKKKEVLVKKEPSENTLENCDFTSLYKIKDTIAAFEGFRETIIKCWGQQNQKNVSTELEIDTMNGETNFCNTERKQSPGIALLCINSTYIQSLNYLNTFFSTLGEQLATNMLKEMNTSETNLANAIDTSSSKFNFELSPTNENEVRKILDDFKPKNRPSWEHEYLNKSIIVRAKNILTPPITYICNLSFSTGVVPDSIKVAKIVPIFKSGDPNIPSNYRPISIITSVSNIIEKLVHIRLRSFLESNNILSDNQFGFRIGRSTKNAVTETINFIGTKLQSGQKCIGIFLDLHKAFDTISRPILLKKMESIGIRGLALEWFQSYFANRQQTVSIRHSNSDLAVVKYGVSQGSSLGPMLFLIYFNDLLQFNVTQTKSIAFADDTLLIIHGDSWKNVMEVAQINLDRVYNWLQKNLMTFNFSKTKFLAFRFSNQTAPDIPISIKIRDCIQKDTLQCKKISELEQAHSTRYLGFIIDEHLNVQPSHRVKPKRT